MVAVYDQLYDMQISLDNRITDKLGETLKCFRVESGYTREQISERADISLRYLIAIENEGKIPKFPVLCNLLRAMGLSADRIVYPETCNRDPTLDQLIRLIQTCDEEDRRLVFALVNAIHDRKQTT